jgi:hypothetical protein
MESEIARLSEAIRTQDVVRAHVKEVEVKIARYTGTGCKTIICVCVCVCLSHVAYILSIKRCCLLGCSYT